MRKLKQADQPAPAIPRPKWVALTVEEPAPGETAPPIVVRVGGIAVEVRDGFAPRVFAEVIRTLTGLC
jgi:hypothetical protein